MTLPPSVRALAIDTELRDRVRQIHVHENHVAHLLARMDADKLHEEFGYAKVVDYAVERLGLARSVSYALLRIGKKLPDLPHLDRAMADGQLGWTKVREMVRVATPETERDWVALAGSTTSRVLERAVKASEGGAPPSHVDLADVPETVRMVLVLSAGEADVIRAALQQLRRRCGVDAEDIDDGALIAMMLQRLLVDVDPETAPSPDRTRFVVVNAGGAPADSLPSEAACDAEVVDLTHGPKRGHTSHTVPPAIRRAVLCRDGRRCQVPGCSNRLWLDIHHVVHQAHGGRHVESNLVTTCCVHHRVTHDGRLGIRVAEGGFVFTFPKGREVFVPHGSSRVPLVLTDVLALGARIPGESPTVS